MAGAVVGFKVGDEVRGPDAEPADRASYFWSKEKIGMTGTVVEGDPSPSGAVVVARSGFPNSRYYFKPHWLTLVKAAPVKAANPEDDYITLSYPYKGLFDLGNYGPNLYTCTKPPKPPSEHDELLTLRAERDSERRWAAHWKGIADRSEDHFKRSVEAEVACAAVTDALEASDTKIEKLEGEIFGLKTSRDSWMRQTAEESKARSAYAAATFDAENARDRALTARNLALAVASSCFGSAAYMLYSTWGLL